MKRSGTYAGTDGVTHSWEQRPLPLDAIYLTQPQWLTAAAVGCARWATNIASGRYGEDGNGYDGSRGNAATADPRNLLANDVLAAVAEAAVARALNVHWRGDWDKPKGDGDLVLPFVGRADVRSTTYANGHLLVHQNEPDICFVFVCDFGFTNGDAAMRCPGWILGADAQRPEFWREKGDRGCTQAAYFVPQSQLLPLSSLKSWTEGKGTG